MCILVFFWLFSLPLLLIATCFALPLAYVGCILSLLVSLLLQWYHRGHILVRHPVRRWLSRIPWHEWFPCNTLAFDGPAVVGVHPHGLLCCGAVAGIHLVPGSQTVLAVAPVLFYVPVIGWMLRVLGCIPARRDVMRTALAHGHILLVVPGGVPEIVLAESGDDLQRFPRHGFLSLDKTKTVWCVFVRGECALFTMVRAPFRALRTWLSWKLNIPLTVPLFLGWYGTWLPKRTPLTLFRQKTLPNKDAYTKTLHRLMYLSHTDGEKSHVTSQAQRRTSPESTRSTGTRAATT